MAVYLYCVVKSARRPVASRVPAGLPAGTAPETREVSRGLWIATSDVPLETYGPAQIEPRLRDLDWVAEIAVAHEAVVEHFFRRKGAVVIPAKLFTMFSSTEKAVADVARRRDAIDRVMKHVAGCEEWGIRITRQVAPVSTTSGPRATSGVAFLASKKAARDAVVNARADAAAAAVEAFRRLAKHARDANQRDRRPEPGTNPPILEAAFLVPAGRRSAFKVEAKRQAAACATTGVDLTLSGPWPAYNFIGTAS